MGFEIGFWGFNLLVQLGFIWGLKKESAPESTPLIEKMKPELSPIFEKKREREPNWNHHLENDANWNWWFPLEPKN